MRAIPHTAGRHVAMPLGGIGTGNLAICADGALRQWQLHNTGNHRGDLPNSFFALRVARPEPPLSEVRVLQAPPADPASTHTPMVSDDHVPGWQRDLLGAFQGVSRTTFRATYPFAEVEYHDDTLPVKLTMQTFTPMVPLDVDRSSIPAAMFTFTVTNPDTIGVHGWLGATAQNPVGHDGTTAPQGVHAPGYGGNTNQVRREAGWTSLVMENAHVETMAAGAGQFVLSCDAPSTSALPQWTHPRQFIAFLDGRTPVGADRAQAADHGADFQVSGPSAAGTPSPVGATWNGGLVAPFTVAPGETATIRVAMTWHFPNRYVNFVQFGPHEPRWGPTRFWLGNHYATIYPDALAVTARVRDDWESLEASSRDWVSTLSGSALDPQAVEHLAAQAVVPRSPTCFRTADGAFFGFEGVLGQSTTMWSGDVGGSCPLNCTHVWNYAHALARLFPSLERSMRGDEFDVMQAPNGSIPHRVISPTYLPQLWDRPIGGPLQPALDGMLGTVLKSYREVRGGAGRRWLEQYWPNLVRLVGHIRSGWDPQDTGVLRGIQPSTHDIDLRGVNPYMGTMWLAALRAGEEMARLIDAEDCATEWRELFARGSAAYDKLLFNGDYYVQVLADDETREYQWETGCLSDQLIGQWWAHLLDLGHILPREHVHTSLRAIVRHNLREHFDGFEHPYRVFADRDDTGLLMCSWPTGGRPETPTRYADEVWTGTEYQVAAHCLIEGLTDEGMRILSGLWSRYDGTRRNPYNQVECGDHYVRAMAGWTILDAMTGQRWNAVTGRLQMRRPPAGSSWPVILEDGWGELAVIDDDLELRCHSGVMTVHSLSVIGPDEALADSATEGGLGMRQDLPLSDAVRLDAGERIRWPMAGASAQAPREAVRADERPREHNAGGGRSILRPDL